MDILNCTTSNNLLNEYNKTIKESIVNNKRLLTNKLTNKEFINILSNDIELLQTFHSTINFLEMYHPDSAIKQTCSKIDKYLTNYTNKLNTNKDLFNSIKNVCTNSSNLDAVDKRFITTVYENYKKYCLGDNQLMSKIINKKKYIFRKIIDIENKQITLSSNDVKGLPDNLIKTFKRSKSGYLITLNKKNYNLCKKYIESHITRLKIDLEYNNNYNEIVQPFVELIVLLDDYSKSISFDNYIDYKTSNQMIKNSNNAKNFLSELFGKLDMHYKNEMDTIKKISGNKKIINDSDIDYYLTKWKKQYGVNEVAVSEYFQVHGTLNRIIKIYEEIFHIKFKKCNLQKWHSTVIPYAIIKDGEKIGYIYLDMYSRSNKITPTRCFCIQPGITDTLPVVCLAASLGRTTSLMHYNDVVNIFHEFTHLMHNIFGRTKHSIFSGTCVEQDFIDAPAQLIEKLCWDGDIIRRLSKHYITGDTLPKEDIDKLIKSKYIDFGLKYKKGIFNSLFEHIIYSSNDYITYCRQISKTRDTNKMINLLNDIYNDLFNEIMIDKNKSACYKIYNNNHKIMPIEIVNNMIIYNTLEYCHIWSSVLATDMYNSRVKNTPVNSIGHLINDCILKNGGEEDGYDMICKYLDRKPTIKKFPNSEENTITNSIFLKTDQIEVDTVTNKFSEIDD